MRFHYVASQPDGRVIEGNMDAAGPIEVLNYIGTQGLRPISVKESAEFLGKAKKRLFRQTITIVDKIFLTKYLSLMLKVGTDLFKALDILIADFDKPVVKSFLLEIRSALERGQPFYSTFVRYPQYFSPVFINMIKAGEASGGLERVFADLAVMLEKEKDLRGRVKAALVYPVILLVLSVVVLLFLVSFALPKIAAVFTGGGFDPPLFSKVVFAIGLFLGRHVLAVLLILLGVGGGGSFVLFRTEAGRRWTRIILNKAPIVRQLVKKIALQRFASTLSSLMKSGLPILDSLEITADAAGHAEIQVALRRVSREGIMRGLTIGDAFKREPAFPAVVVNLIAISEKSGHLDEILRTIAEFYDSEIDASLKTLVSFLEPALLLMIGSVVGLIALSVIVPIYQLVGQF